MQSQWFEYDEEHEVSFYDLENELDDESLGSDLDISCIKIMDKEKKVKTDVYYDKIHECGVCTETFTKDKIFVPIFCEHEICKDCAVQHYETQIKNFSVENVVCPFPACTNISSFSATKANEYFSLTQYQLSMLISKDVSDLFERKLRDWNLAADPNFIWCLRCENGAIVERSSTENIFLCSDCGCKVCISCKLEWSREHLGMCCNDYKIWKESVDTNQKHLKNYLSKHGLECPSCHTKFIKPAGGCLHLTCPVSTCKYQFCEGCFQPFRNGKDCTESLLCNKQGFHAHHPRNCFYFLRDWEPQRLQKLLQHYGIPYDRESNTKSKFCEVIEQKETDSGFVDEACGSTVQSFEGGFCRKHYVRYLGQLVLKNNVDPVDEYEINELIFCLEKANVSVPEKTHDFRALLIKKIKDLGGLKYDLNTLSDAQQPNSEEWSDSDDCCNLSEDDDDEKLGEAAAITAPSSPVVACKSNMWICSFCTFHNSLKSNICEICCRTPVEGHGDYEIWEDGVECQVCTLINSAELNSCEICGTALVK